MRPASSDDEVVDETLVARNREPGSGGSGTVPVQLAGEAIE
jgi:hypothetical protein